MGAPSRSTRREVGLWLAAGAALSPVLVDLARSLREVDASPSILLAPCLLALHGLRTGWPRRAPDARGLILVALGLGLEILGLVSGTGSLARLGLPSVFVGVALLAGRPAAPVAALSLFAVPPPTVVLVQGSPGLESWIAGLASLPFRALGAPLEAGGPLLRAPSGRIELTAFHTGIPLAILLAELGWYAGLRRGAAAFPSLAGRALLCAAAAPALQIAGVALAIGLLLLGPARLARLWLDYGLGLAIAGASIARIERRAAAGTALGTRAAWRKPTRESASRRRP
jgi:hypothetical protein